MPALSYKGRFVEYVEAGLKPQRNGKRIKRQSIRNFRKYPVKPGDTLYHYFAQRTKFCRKLGESICESAEKIIIREKSITFFSRVLGSKPVKCNYRSLVMLDAFAIADGFENWREMKLWWKLTHGPDCFPFVGQLIKW